MRSLKRLALVFLWFGPTCFSLGYACPEAFVDSADVAERYLVTGSPTKWQQFREMFGEGQIERLDTDLPEIDADHLQVIIHKASQIPYVPGKQFFVEDSSLEVEGAPEFGVNVKWQVHKIGAYVGRRATWVVYLAYRQGDEVMVFKGQISGTIVERQGPGSGFGPFFMPDGDSDTLAASGYRQSARQRAFHAWRTGQIYGRFPATDQWDGPFQNGS